MTSYDHGYDADRRHSRRHDSFRDHPHDHLNLPPTHDALKRPREHRRSVSRRHGDDTRPHSSRSSVHSSDDQRSRQSRHGHDPQSSVHSSDDQRVRQSQRRPTWPPAPHVESETRSLAREAGGMAHLRRLEGQEVPSRGTIDQDPLIEDVAEYINKTDRRFVMLQKTKDGRTNIPTPPTSEDERKRTQRRPSRLNTDVAPSHLPPELQKRTASPYSTTTSQPNRASKILSNTFLSPDVLTPPAVEFNQRRRTVVEPLYTRSPRTSPISRKAKDYFGSGYPEHAIEDQEDTSRPSSRGSQARAGAHDSAELSSGKQFISDRDNRRQTDTGAAWNRPRGIELTPRASPLVAAATAAAATTTTLGEAVRSARENRSHPPRSSTLNTPGFLRETSSGSRNASPAASIHSQRSSSPPPARLTRYSTDLSQDHNLSSPDSRRASVISSRAGSRPGTPPLGSIAMPRMPHTDDDWSSLLAANAARWSKPGPTRLSAAMRADSMPNVHRTNSNASSALPYPVNEGLMTPDVFMPQETEHQWFPTTKPEIKPQSRKPATMPSMPRQDDRPVRQPRHSFTTPKDAKSSRPELVSQTSATEVRPTKQEAEAMLKRGLPGCPRPQAVAGYDDWYTLVGAPSLDFCPKCIDLFERTVYRKCFRRSLPRDLSTKIKCAFGTPWIRLAYLLSIQERLPSLKLMKDLAEIDLNTDSCPGHQMAVRTWHGLRDDQGLFVRDFNICQADILKLQHLLPTFKGFFQRLPDHALYEKRRCALRPDTHRFSQYLDAIIGLHDKAHMKNTTPERMPFVTLVERKLSYRERERDVLLIDGLWHYIPSLTSFTVCEDCFEEVVEPEVKKGSDLAKRFNRAVQPNYGEGSVGTSCQLYSPRMRQVFRKAVKDNDLKYLTRKAKERREAELHLQEKHGSLLRKAQRIAPDGWSATSGSEEQREKRRLERELEKITAEWREDWE